MKIINVEPPQSLIDANMSMREEYARAFATCKHTADQLGVEEVMGVHVTEDSLHIDIVGSVGVGNLLLIIGCIAESGPRSYRFSHLSEGDQCMVFNFIRSV